MSNYTITHNNMTARYAVMKDGEVHTPDLDHSDAIALRNMLINEEKQQGIPSDSWELL